VRVDEGIVLGDAATTAGAANRPSVNADSRIADIISLFIDTHFAELYNNGLPDQFAMETIPREE
jgi:hypothetical protein